MFHVHGERIKLVRSTHGRYYGNFVSVSKKSGEFPKGLFFKGRIGKIRLSCRVIICGVDIQLNIS